MIKRFILAAALAGAFCACQALPPVNEPEEKESQEQEEEGLPPVDDPSAPTLISAEIPAQIGTKVSLTPVGDGLSLAWEAGDCLRIVGETPGQTGGDAVLFSIVEEGMTPSKAGFSGKGVNGSAFTVLYPGTYATEQEWNGRSYAAQVQKGNASTAHLEWNAKLSGLASYSSLIFEEREGIEYSQNGVVKFVFTLPEHFESLEAISLGAQEAVFPLSNSADGAMSDELKLVLQDFDFTNRDIVAYLMVSAVPVTLETYTITLFGPDGQKESVEKTAPEGGLVIGGGMVSVVSLSASDMHEPLFWGGTGTQEDPYQIKTVKHLKNMGLEEFRDKDICFKLIGDIAFSEEQADAYEEINLFCATLDGDGHSISGLKTPLFGNLYGSVKNIDISANISHNGTSNARFSGTDYGIGILAHYAYRDAAKNPDNYLQDVTVRGSVVADGVSKTHNYLVGGMLGASNGVPMTGCRNYASVSVDNMNLGSSSTRVGGLVGAIQSALTANATDCENHGTVSMHAITTSGEVSVGGVFGHSGQGVTISNCDNASTGVVTITEDCNNTNIAWVAAGGVLGSSDAQVKLIGCDNHAAVTNSANAAKQFCVGGVAAKLHTDGSNAGGVSISNCSNDGAVLDNSQYATRVSHFVGGIAGHIKGAAITSYDNVYVNVSGCTNDGTVTLSAATGGWVRVGGIVGLLEKFGNFSNCENKKAVSCLSPAVTLVYIGGGVGHVGACANLDGMINRGNISATCVASGASDSAIRIGGIVGNYVLGSPFSGAADPRGTLNNSYNWGSVSVVSANTANVYEGGLVGGCTSGAGFILESENHGDISYTVTGGVTLGRLDIGGIAGYYGTVGGKLDGNRSNCSVSASGTITILHANQILGFCGTGSTFTVSNNKLAGSVKETSITSGNFASFIATKTSGSFTGFETNSFWAE